MKLSKESLEALLQVTADVSLFPRQGSELTEPVTEELQRQVDEGLATRAQHEALAFLHYIKVHG